LKRSRKKYNEEIKEVAKKEDVGFVNLLPAWEEHKNSLTTDGIHPNKKGHEIIFRAVQREINKQKEGE